MSLLNGQVNIEFIYRCDVWVNAQIEASQRFHVDLKTLTSKRYLHFGRFREVGALEGRMACVAYANYIASKRMIYKHLRECGTAWYIQPTDETIQIHPCSDVSNCYCSDESCSDEYTNCPLDTCNACTDKHCCCLVQTSVTNITTLCDDPANCHCYMDNCFDLGFKYCARGTCPPENCNAEHCCCCEQDMDQKACLDRLCICIDESLMCSDKGMEYCSPSQCEGQCNGPQCCCSRTFLNWMSVI